MIKDREIALAKIDAIIERHLPYSGHERDNQDEASTIYWGFISATYAFQGWKPEEEIEKLERIERGLSQINQEISNLQISVRWKLITDSLPIEGSNLGVFHALSEAERCVKLGIESAKKEAARGLGGRTSFDAVRVLKVCRDIWKRRGGEGSVKTANAKNPGPFAGFVEEIFAELGVKGHKGKIMTAASAMRATERLIKQLDEP